MEVGGSSETGKTHKKLPKPGRLAQELTKLHLSKLNLEREKSQRKGQKSRLEHLLPRGQGLSADGNIEYTSFSNFGKEANLKGVKRVARVTTEQGLLSVDITVMNDKVLMATRRLNLPRKYPKINGWPRWCLKNHDPTYPL